MLCHRLAVRAVLALCLLGLAACVVSHEQTAGAGGDDSLAPEGAECATADDCVAVSATCCGCPGYAQPGDRQDGCDDVECPADPPGACPDLVTACVDGACTLACAPVTCEMTCPDGFAADEAGCLTCACAAPPDAPGACVVDGDCAQVPADCCGCARGGADTAVPVGAVDAHVEGLGCPADPTEAACPEIDVCDAAAAPRCVAGQCVLQPAGADAESPHCGRPDLPPCPEGAVCVLNADPDASMDGVGTCQVP